MKQRRNNKYTPKVRPDGFGKHRFGHEGQAPTAIARRRRATHLTKANQKRMA